MISSRAWRQVAPTVALGDSLKRRSSDIFIAGDRLCYRYNHGTSWIGNSYFASIPIAVDRELNLLLHIKFQRISVLDPKSRIMTER